jgi:transcriptional regulator with GAF, ATPase, and Fis domain
VKAGVLPITMPPLRHRREDLPLLLQHLVEKLTR